MGNKLLKNLTNKPDEFKQGQVWFLAKDTDEYPSMEIVLTDTQYADNIGIVRGAALTAVKNGGDDFAKRESVFKIYRLRLAKAKAGIFY